MSNKTRSSFAEMVDAQIKWLSEQPFNITLTLHYHQRMQNHRGGFHQLTRETATRTTNRFMSGLDRALLGLSAQKKGQFLNRVTFHEFDLDGRIHTHILLMLPDQFSIDQFRRAVDSAQNNVDWIDRTVFFTEIEPGSQRNFVAYCHKDGLAPFCPEATKMHQLNVAQI